MKLGKMHIVGVNTVVRCRCSCPRPHYEYLLVDKLGVEQWLDELFIEQFPELLRLKEKFLTETKEYTDEMNYHQQTIESFSRIIFFKMLHHLPAQPAYACEKNI